MSDWDTVRHQDASGMSGSPLGVFAGDRLIETVDRAADPYGDITAARIAAETGARVEVLLICHRHPGVSAVDCLICVPDDPQEVTT